MRATTGGPARDSAIGRRAWLVWAAALLAYVLAVMQRTSLGATGIDAAERFGISPSALSAFVFLQIGVYALGQIPAGLLVDRFGPRWVLAVAGVLLGGGQVLLATAGSLPSAAVARVLVGSGDALVFASIMVVVPRWFPGHRVPLLTQLTTLVGQAGQVLSLIPLLLLVHSGGWTLAFTVAAAASIVGAVVAGLLVRNGPHPAVPTDPVPVRELLAQVRAIWRRPGTRLGFFGHLGTQFSMMTFSLLWGVPYLVSAQGWSAVDAGWLLTMLVVASVCVGPLIGALTARLPGNRSTILLGVIALTATAWTVVLLWPGRAPGWLLVVLVLVLATNGPGSVVGFDLARTHNPRSALAVAQGMVNIGGYSASLVLLAAVGAVLTALGGFTPEAFRVAWLLQYPIWGLAVVGILVNRRVVRRAQGRAPSRFATACRAVVRQVSPAGVR
ncbi:MFS transporter [Pseudonocardia ailaonensis]|uniref:MFS transporter n=1 Tax=Pseudonocardia ailaonensis TaxID=367279 RepID=A0ABN2NFE8_9PSEU